MQEENNTESSVDMTHIQIQIQNIDDVRLKMKYSHHVHRQDPETCNTLLHQAIANSAAEDVKDNILKTLQAGADVTLENKAGMLPIEMAFQHKKVGEYFLYLCLKISMT